MDFEAFYDAPDAAALCSCTKEQLVEIARHYRISFEDDVLKDELKALVMLTLYERGVLPRGAGGAAAVPLDASSRSPVKTEGLLTFEQQERLLRLQLELENTKLQLVRESAVGGAGGSGAARARETSEGSSNLRYVPKFNEKDPDTFFTLFERVAAARGWPDAEKILLLQCVVTGKAQEAYSAVCAQENLTYNDVKVAVLKAYQLTAEAYRQKFRQWVKGAKQTHMEFVNELTTHFKRWCVAGGVVTFEQLSDVIILEQFKNSLPSRVVTYLNEREPDNVIKAAQLADDFVLTHQSFGSGVPPVSGGDVRGKNVMFGAVCKNPPRAGRSREADVCHYCRNVGHWKDKCPLLKSKGRASPAMLSAETLRREVQVPVESGGCSGFEPFITDAHVSLVGSSECVKIKVLRDTGAKHSFIVESALPFSSNSAVGDFILMRGMELGCVPVPRHNVTLKSGFVSGVFPVAVRPALPLEGVDMVLGNDICGGAVWASGPPSPLVLAKPLSPDLVSVGKIFPICAVTRAQAKKSEELVVKTSVESVALPVLPVAVSKEDWVSALQSDGTLSSLREQVVSVAQIRDLAQGYFEQDSMLVRKWSDCVGDVVLAPTFQLVVPEAFRSHVLRAAHDQSGHFGVRKTYLCTLKHFFWPRMKRDVSLYIKSCHVCQLTGKPNQKILPAPLQPIPAIHEPFEYLLVDCVGPLPVSKSGSKFLLTVMCQTTRYPAAFPLRSITTKAVVKALSQFVSIFGVPKVIQSDRGSNFTSHMFAQVLKLLGVNHNLSTPYHAQSQGALERFHQTLKSLLRAFCVELDRDWEEGLPWLMLAAREAVQDSTGFSPNDLVFGHVVRGPLATLKDNLVTSDAPTNLIDYVNGFRHRLYTAGSLARERLQLAQKGMKAQYDRRAELHVFSPGDQVLVLKPLVGSPFQARYSGPFSVKERISDLNYLLSTPGRRKATQLCHVNLLKPYYQRSVSGVVSSVSPALSVGDGVVVPGEDGVPGPDDSALCGRLKNSESLGQLDSLLSHLSPFQRSDLVCLIKRFPELFGDVPSRTSWIVHDIDVGNAEPITQRFYRMSPDKLSLLDTEVNYMLTHGLAVPSSSCWASPCILVPKPDRTPRFCTDFRKVNSVTKSDSFPLPRMDDCIDLVGSAKFLSKFDLLKGYWQVPLSERASEIASFITPSGLYSYTVMPFGLRNAPATFQRLMNRVTAGLEGCSVYLDDLVVFSDSWHLHLQRIKALFERLSEAQLTVNLAKCEFGRATVTYLGRVVGQGMVAPVDAKVAAVAGFPRPATKKELQRFLGLVGYYRSFCCNFSSVVFPLTELLKADSKFVWSDECQQAFENVKTLLCSCPVLAAPCFSRPFQLQVDASQVGAGAVLLQGGEEDGVLRPVCFFSRKFNRYQSNYSVIEKEALALVWAIQHFEVYVGGGVPLVVYTDHNPLTFLKSLKSPNQRLVRWALFLQAYDLDIRHVKGESNVQADALSRAPLEWE